MPCTMALTNKWQCLWDHVHNFLIPIAMILTKTLEIKSKVTRLFWIWKWPSHCRTSTWTNTWPCHNYRECNTNAYRNILFLTCVGPVIQNALTCLDIPISFNRHRESWIEPTDRPFCYKSVSTSISTRSPQSITCRKKIKCDCKWWYVPKKNTWSNHFHASRASHLKPH